MSFKPEFSTDATGKFYENALRFSTYREAVDYARDLFCRWTLVRDSRVVSSDDPVNYSFINGELVEVRHDCALDYTSVRR